MVTTYGMFVLVVGEFILLLRKVDSENPKIQCVSMCQ